MSQQCFICSRRADPALRLSSLRYSQSAARGTVNMHDDGKPQPFPIQSRYERAQPLASPPDNLTELRSFSFSLPQSTQAFSQHAVFAPSQSGFWQLSRCDRFTVFLEFCFALAKIEI